MQVFDSVDRFWSDERVAELRRHFDNGLSNNQIAMAMSIRSRNAVIGKLHRLGLVRDKGPGACQSLGAKGIVCRVRAPKPAPKLPPKRPTQAFVRTKPITDSITDIAVDPGANRVSLLSVGRDQCRWPAADDGSAAMVCGDLAIGRSYCARHLAISVQRPVVSRSG